MSKVTYRRLEGTGRHSFKQGGKRHSLRPGDTVELPIDYDLGTHASKYAVISGKRRLRTRKAEIEKEQSMPQKSLEIAKIGRKFNVINPDNPDKPLNDEPFTIQEARDLIDILVEEPEQ